MKVSHRRSQRHGIIIPLAAVLLVFLLGMIAFAVDLGMIANTRTELQAATDSAAYAGAGALINGTTAATAEAQEFYTSNRAAGKQLTASTAAITFGIWNTTTRIFSATNSQPNAVKVVSTLPSNPLFFGAVFNKTSYGMTATAVATYLPRNIILVLDYSRSMCFDSAFDNIGLLSQATVEANMLKIWQDLGSPTYGTLTWTPKQYGSSNQAESKAMKKFKLDQVNYPYPDGSWSEYVDFVQSDATNAGAGYQNKYGMLNFIQYLQTYQAQFNQTPVLYQASQQPLTAVKDAVDVFLSYLLAHSTDDQVGLTIYSGRRLYVGPGAIAHEDVHQRLDQSPRSTSRSLHRRYEHFGRYEQRSAELGRQRSCRREENDDPHDRRRSDAADGQQHAR